MREAEEDNLVEKRNKKMVPNFGDDKTGLAGLSRILLQKAIVMMMASYKRMIANIIKRG